METKVLFKDLPNLGYIKDVDMNKRYVTGYLSTWGEYIRQLWNNAVIPELEYLKDDLNKVAAQYNKAAGTTLKFDYCLDDIPELQADIATQAAALAQAWWLTPDERREAMGFEETELPEMQLYYMPMGLIPTSEMTTPPSDEEVSKFYNGKNRY